MKHLFFIILILPSIANAAVYKCKGLEGRVTYLSIPCKKTQSAESFQLKNNKLPTDAYIPDLNAYRAKAKRKSKKLKREEQYKKEKDSRELMYRHYDLIY